MKKILLASLVVLILLLSGISFAYTTDDIFTKLIYNKAELTYGEAKFEVCNPLPISVTIDTNKLKISVDEYKGSLASAVSLFYDKATSSNVTTYKETCSPYNITQVNGTIYYFDNCTSSVDGSYLSSGIALTPFTTLAWLSHECKNITLRSSWNAKIGAISKDWLPEVNISGIAYKQIKWAWWNTSWAKERTIRVTENSGNTLSYWIMNFTLDMTTLTGLKSDCSDLRFTNTANTTQFNWTNLTICDNTQTAVQMWVHINETISASGIYDVNMYYNNSDASAGASYPDKVFDFYDELNTITSNWTNYNGVTTGSAGGRTAVLVSCASQQKFLRMTVGNTSWMQFEAFLNSSSNAIGMAVRKTACTGCGIATDGRMIQYGSGGTSLGFQSYYLSSGLSTGVNVPDIRGAWHNISINKAKNSTLTGYVDLLLNSTVDKGTGTVLQLGNDYTNDNIVIYYSKIRIRNNYVVPEPTYSVGGEQSSEAPSPYISLLFNFSTINFSTLIQNTTNNPSINSYRIDVNTTGCTTTYVEFDAPATPLTFSVYTIANSNFKFNYTKNTTPFPTLNALDASYNISVVNNDIVYPFYYLSIPAKKQAGAYSTTHVIKGVCV
jgi:hypothetical protein